MAIRHKLTGELILLDKQGGIFHEGGINHTLLTWFNHINYIFILQFLSSSIKHLLINHNLNLFK